MRSGTHPYPLFVKHNKYPKTCNGKNGTGRNHTTPPNKISKCKNTQPISENYEPYCRYQIPDFLFYIHHSTLPPIQLHIWQSLFMKILYILLKEEWDYNKEKRHTLKRYASSYKAWNSDDLSKIISDCF